MEQVEPLRGLLFPGNIVMPDEASGEYEKRRRNDKAIETAHLFETDPQAFWTDGSALPGGTCASAVVGFVEGEESEDQQREKWEP